MPPDDPLLKSSRSNWWNRDYLELMVKRWGLPRHARLLDVGCGRGHWGLAIGRAVRPAQIVLLDRDGTHLSAARDAATDVLSPLTKSYTVRADGASMPFPNESFDLVTCQTVLMHSPRPQEIIAEMSRVVKVGGTVCCVEPHDIANAAALDAVFLARPPDEVSRHLHFWAAYARGRLALGLGDLCVGERLPRLLANVGLKDIRVHICDKAQPLIPPYRGSEQVALLSELRCECERTMRDIKEGWEVDGTRACVLAGGASAELLEAYGADVAARYSSICASIQDQTYTASGGHLLYITQGIRPAAG